MSKNEVLVTSGFAALANTDSLNEMMTEDLNGLDLTFDRIKIPAGGSTAFEVPGDGDEPELAKEIECVILNHHPAYAYYAKEYTGGSNPPECGSFDGITGVGTPGGTCKDCPYNKFGSGNRKKSKACKNRRLLYILVEGELFPMLLSLPVGSLNSFTKYLKRQISKGRRLSGIVTKISLQKAKNEDNITFSQAVFTHVRDLTQDEKTAVEPIIMQAKAYASHLTVDSLAQDEAVPFVDEETGEIIEPLN